MKRVVLLLSLFLTFIFEPICAQQLHVKRFEKDPNDVKPRTQEGGLMNANKQYCALLKVLLFEEGAKFSGSDMVKASDLEVNKYRVFMSPGAKMLEVAVPRFEDLEIRFADINPEIVSLEAGTAYWLVISSSYDGQVVVEIDSLADQLAKPIRQDETIQPTEQEAPTQPVIKEETSQPDNQDVPIQPAKSDAPTQATASDKPTQHTEKKQPVSSSFYLQGGYQVGSLSGLGINVGGYFNHVNAEIGLTMGLSAINETYDGYNQIECKPMAFGAKVGYGLDVAKGFRLTPQVGLSLVSISGTQSVGQKSEDLKCYALPGTLSLRADYAFNSHVGINLTPQLNVALSKSATFDQLANQISQIKGLGTGFGLSIGIFVQF